MPYFWQSIIQHTQSSNGSTPRNYPLRPGTRDAWQRSSCQVDRELLQYGPSDGRWPIAGKNTCSKQLALANSSHCRPQQGTHFCLVEFELFAVDTKNMAGALGDTNRIRIRSVEVDIGSFPQLNFYLLKALLDGTGKRGSNRGTIDPHSIPCTQMKGEYGTMSFNSRLCF